MEVLEAHLHLAHIALLLVVLEGQEMAALFPVVLAA
jgi:hypothetical protein